MVLLLPFWHADAEIFLFLRYSRGKKKKGEKCIFSLKQNKCDCSWHVHFCNCRKNMAWRVFLHQLLLHFPWGRKKKKNNTQVGAPSLKNYPPCCDIREIHKFILYLILVSISTLHRAVKNVRSESELHINKIRPARTFCCMLHWAKHSLTLQRLFIVKYEIHTNLIRSNLKFLTNESFALSQFYSSPSLIHPACYIQTHRKFYLFYRITHNNNNNSNRN